MPHVEISCYKGRTEEQKKLCAEKIAQVISETLGCNMSSISVAINDVDSADWEEQIVNKIIIPNKNNLYKKAE